jgi:DNA replication protein DnaC
MVNNIQNFDTRKEFLELYKNIDMLYIDEFSYNFSSDIVEGLMFSIFDYRYNQRKRTNFATNRVSISCPRMSRRVREMVKGVTVNKEWREHLGV